MQLINILDPFQFPFMQRALFSGIFIGALLAFLGVFVILRKMSFFGDGIAHASLAGIAIGILTSLNPLITALVFSVTIAVIMYFVERKTTISSDAIIGIFFTTSMALGVLLISFQSGYKPELISFLFGNILSITSSELLYTVIVAVFVLATLATKYRDFALLVFDRESAYISGINVVVLELFLYIALAISIVLGVKLLGIVLVSALLIIPASTAKLISKSFKNLITNSLLFSVAAVVIGLTISYYLDIPSGATIVLTGTGLFILIFGLSRLHT